MLPDVVEVAGRTLGDELMLPMSRRTYRWLTTSLLGLSGIVFFGSIAALQADWLQRADVLIRLAVFPGGLIAGGVLVLMHGCVEHHADVLPPQYRARRSSRPDWEDLYDPAQMPVVETILMRFARSHGFRTSDGFQFGPEDRLEELMREFYPGRSDAGDLLRRRDLTSTVADVRLTLREYVDARMGPVSGSAGEVHPESDSSRIDRQARDRLVHAIRRYMDEAVTAFGFDEDLHGIRTATADGTVQFVADCLWYHYDDCKDHLAGLSQPEWDYFQRLILLLESSAVVKHDRRRRWCVRQGVAGAGLIAFGLCLFRLGIGWHCFGLALLFGPLSLLLSYWRNRSERPRAEERLHLAPFASISELRATRKAVSGFSKKRYPAGAEARRVHGRLMTAAVWLQTAVVWSFLSPLILLFQTLPEKDVHTQICQGPGS